MKRFLGFFLTLAMIFSLGTVAFAAVNDTGFSDVAADSWFADAAMYVRDHNVMNGTSATTFGPNDTMTRAMLATVLYRMAGSPAVSGVIRFSDVPANAYYADAAAWASANSIVSGYGSGLFGSNDPVTREQIATILWRYAGSPAAEAGTDFADEDSIASYAAAAVDWARANGIINGISGNRFAPRASATRAQVAVILYHYLTMRGTEATDVPEGGPRILVAYFSRVGNTDFPADVDAVTSASINTRNDALVGNVQLAAEAIHAQVGGDLEAIIAENAYPVDYEETVSQNHQEQQDETLPALSGNVDIDNYDVIFIGYPIWAMTMPAPVKTFLTEHDFSGKTVVPFCTHGGYGAGRTESLIRELCPDAQVLPVLAIEDSDLDRADTLVASWLDTLPDFDNGAAAARKITLTMGGKVITAELNNTPAAREFANSLPTSVSMIRMGEHEYYGSLDAPLSESGNTLQTGYTVGDLAFWTPGDLFAIYFDEPDTPPQGLIILGHITSDLSVFSDFGSREVVQISLAD